MKNVLIMEESCDRIIQKFVSISLKKTSIAEYLTVENKTYVFFWDRVLLYSPMYPWDYLSCLRFLVLGFQVWTITFRKKPVLIKHLKIICLFCVHVYMHGCVAMEEGLSFPNMDAGNWTRVFSKSSNHSLLLGHLFSP